MSENHVKWSILILTQPSRTVLLDRLLFYLKPQTWAHSQEVELCIKTFDRTKSLGENRSEMVRSAKGEYVSFVDDDDMVPLNYVAKILPLLDGVDYIGFRLQCWWDGKELLPTFHSLRFARWYEDGTGYYRDLSHVNPIKRELALKVPFDGGHGEDHRWADQLRGLNVVRTEHYIDEVMYEYHFRSDKKDGVAYESYRSLE